jgi:sulfite reductase alpha subunit-like flavoprotein
MYSIINDPFKSNEEKANSLEVLFNLEKFGDNKTGLCTEFLSTIDKSREFKVQMGPAYRVLSIPPAVENKTVQILMVA